MIVRGRELPLIRPIETQWGIYQPGWVVKILSGADGGGLRVCLDMDGHSPSAVCHEATVVSDDLFVWPRNIKHGTDRGHSRHRSHMEPPCQECRDHFARTKRAQRIRTGTQAGIKVPRDFLAELLQNAPLPAWEKAEQMWGRATVDALLEAS